MLRVGSFSATVGPTHLSNFARKLGLVAWRPNGHFPTTVSSLKSFISFIFDIVFPVLFVHFLRTPDPTVGQPLLLPVTWPSRPEIRSQRYIRFGPSRRRQRDDRGTTCRARRRQQCRLNDMDHPRRKRAGTTRRQHLSLMITSDGHREADVVADTVSASDSSVVHLYLYCSKPMTLEKWLTYRICGINFPELTPFSWRHVIHCFSSIGRNTSKTIWKKNVCFYFGKSRHPFFQGNRVSDVVKSHPSTKRWIQTNSREHSGIYMESSQR